MPVNPSSTSVNETAASKSNGLVRRARHEFKKMEQIDRELLSHAMPIRINDDAVSDLMQVGQTQKFLRPLYQAHVEMSYPDPTGKSPQTASRTLVMHLIMRYLTVDFDVLYDYWNALGGGDIEFRTTSVDKLLLSQCLTADTATHLPGEFIHSELYDYETSQRKTLGNHRVDRLIADYGQTVLPVSIDASSMEHVLDRIHYYAQCSLDLTFSGVEPGKVDKNTEQLRREIEKVTAFLVSVVQAFVSSPDDSFTGERVVLAKPVTQEPKPSQNITSIFSRVSSKVDAEFAPELVESTDASTSVLTASNDTHEQAPASSTHSPTEAPVAPRDSSSVAHEAIDLGSEVVVKIKKRKPANPISPLTEGELPYVVRAEHIAGFMDVSIGTARKICREQFARFKRGKEYRIPKQDLLDYIAKGIPSKADNSGRKKKQSGEFDPSLR